MTAMKAHEALLRPFHTVLYAPISTALLAMLVVAWPTSGTASAPGTDDSGGLDSPAIFASGEHGLRLGHHSAVFGPIVSDGPARIRHHSSVQLLQATGNVLLRRHTSAQRVESLGLVSVKKYAFVNELWADQVKRHKWSIVVSQAGLDTLPVTELPEFEVNPEPCFDIWRKKHADLPPIDLPPGPYGRLRTTLADEVRLSSGEYDFQRFIVRPNSQIFMDVSEGPITVRVAQDLRMRWGSAIHVVGGTAADVRFLVNGEIRLRHHGQYAGTFVGRGDRLVLGHHASLDGALFGRDVRVRRFSTVNHVPFVGGPQVPECDPSDCDDGNPCTSHSCTELGECVTVDNQVACEDGEPCTVGDQCASGACQPGTWDSCDDGSECTEEQCVAGVGCQSSAPAGLDRALWVYIDVLPDAAARAALIARAAEAGMDRLLVSVFRPSFSAAGRLMPEDEHLAALITAAHEQAIEVVAVTGNSDWPAIGCAPDAFPLARVSEIVGYQEAHPGAAFDAVMLDLGATVTDAETMLAFYDCTAATLSAIGPDVPELPIQTVMGANWSEQLSDGRALYEHVLDREFDAIHLRVASDVVGAGCPDIGIACAIGDIVQRAGQIGRVGQFLVDLDVSPGNPSATLHDDGQTALLARTQELAQVFAFEPALAGVAVRHYGIAWASGVEGWPAVGAAVVAPIGCDDGDACTEGDTCAEGSCLAGVPTVCDDGEDCTTDSCDSALGCVTAPRQGACDDGNACTTGEVCVDSVCTAGLPVDCGDGNACTADWCTPEAGCLNDPMRRYSRGMWVFSDEVSVEARRALLVERAVQNRIDTLYISIYFPGFSSSGRLMYEDTDVADLVLKAHAAGLEVIVSYGNPDWPGLGCDLNGFPLSRLTELNGYNATFPDAAVDGVVLDLKPPEPIDDLALLEFYECSRQLLALEGVPLTVTIRPWWHTVVAYEGKEKPTYEHVIDMPLQRVVAVANADSAGGPCPDEGIICNDADEIMYASNVGKPGHVLVGLQTTDCTPDCGEETVTFYEEGQAVMHAEADAVADYFQNERGFGGFTIHRYESAWLSGEPLWPAEDPDFTAFPCSDGEVCTVADACDGDTCGGVPRLCDDGNACTADACVPGVGCASVPATGTCDDGDACTETDVCVDAVCVAGAPIACDDGDACTEDSCDGVAGCQQVPTACDDGNECTTDSCDPELGCQNQPAREPTRAMWVWNDVFTESAAREVLVERAAAADIDVLYVGVFRGAFSAAGRLLPEDDDMSALITAAHEADIEVVAAYPFADWQLFGCDEQSFPYQRLREVADYNDAHPGAAFDGIMLDAQVPEPVDGEALTAFVGCASSSMSERGLDVSTTMRSFWADDAVLATSLRGLSVRRLVVRTYRDTVGEACPSDGIRCAADAIIEGLTADGPEVLVELATVDCGPGCGASFGDDGPAALHQAAEALATGWADHPSFGGFAIDAFGARYLSGDDLWPALDAPLPPIFGCEDGDECTDADRCHLGACEAGPSICEE